MATAIVTGSGGLIGSESVGALVESGWDVIGLENDMRARFFGPEASTSATTERLVREHSQFRSIDLDVRDGEGVERAFRDAPGRIELVDPRRRAALPRLGRARAADRLRGQRASARSTCSRPPGRTRPTRRSSSPPPTRSTATRPTGCRWSSWSTRLELPPDHRYHDGIDTSMSIDARTHSLFGVSKVAADLMVQEYGRYFGMPTVCFRGGCLTGPQHAGAQLHGFLAYLVQLRRRPASPTRSSATAASRCATTSTAPTWSPASPRSHRAPRSRGGLQHRRRPLQQLLDARGDRGLRADQRPRAELGAERRGPRRRPSLVDLRPLRLPRRLPGLGAALRRRGDHAEIIEQNAERWTA